MRNAQPHPNRCLLKTPPHTPHLRTLFSSRSRSPNTSTALSSPTGSSKIDNSPSAASSSIPHRRETTRREKSRRRCRCSRSGRDDDDDDDGAGETGFGGGDWGLKKKRALVVVTGA